MFGSNFTELLGKAHEFKQKLEQMHGQLESREVEGESGAGMVKVRMSGAGVVKSLKIEADLIDPEQGQMLEDLVMAAVNEALKKSKAMMQEETQKLAGGFGLPAGLGGFFR